MTDGSPNTQPQPENDTLIRSLAEPDNDQDTCRICSAPAEPDQPLFHPVNVPARSVTSTKIGFLTTWLSHSKKKTCDVCKYPYSFTKVYAEDMPMRLPVILLLRKFAQQVLFAILFCIRAIIVSFVWLAVLPWITVWTWRMYFAMGNSTAWWISARPRSSSPSSSFFFYNLTSRSQFNSTATNAPLQSSSNDTDNSPLNALLAHPLLRTVSADIFTGQIIATLIVLVFIAVFLLREWISQNARPGVFEEGDPAIAAEREAEQEREGERERQQQRIREQARAVLMERDNQLRRQQQAEAERLRHPSRRHPDRPIRDLPLRPPSRRAQELRATNGGLQTAQLNRTASFPNDAAGPSNAVPQSTKDDQNPSYFQARQERLLAAEKRRSRIKPLADDPESSFRVKGKGKAKATDFEEPIHHQGGPSAFSVNNTLSILATLKQKRVGWGIPDSQTWSLYDFERFEMTRFNIDLMLFTRRMGMAAPEDWTEWLGHAADDAWRWRARRRVLWERFRDEAEQDGLGNLQLPPELSGISLEDLYAGHDRNGIWTPPPAPRLISRLPALTALSQTPSHPSAADDGLSLLTAHKRLRAEGSRSERSFTISSPPFASPDDDGGSSRRVRQRTRSQVDMRPFAFSPTEGGDNHVFPHIPPKPLPFPITPVATTFPTTSQGLSSPPAGSTSPHHPVPTPSFRRPPPHPQLEAAHRGIHLPRRPPTPIASPSSLPLASSRESTPLTSPNLATYHPPEEFLEGSTRQGYFDGAEKVGEEVSRDTEEMDPRELERDVAHFFSEEPAMGQPSDKEDEDEDEDEGDLPGLLADSDDEVEDPMEPRGAARRGPRRIAWGPEWDDGRDADVADEEGLVAEADDDGDGEDAEGEEVDDAALAAQLADEDMVVEDDMEGALEAIGMRGPLYVVAQNAALMIFVLDTAVGLGIWLPFTFGKSTALLSLDPRRALQVLHWPIRVIRIVTDPVVDTIFFVAGYAILPSMTRLFHGFLDTALWALSRVITDDTLEKSAQFVARTRESIVGLPWDKATQYLVSLPSKLAPEPRSDPTPSIIDRILESNHPVVLTVEPYLEALGKQVRINSYQVATGWTKLALGDGTGERVFAIALGYAVIGLLIAFYLNIFTVGTVKSAGRAVRSAVRQQLLVVATFIIVELVLFPLGCGINLDLCSIWLFPEASLESRIAFFQYAPLTAIFYHWVVGTMFMYQFAILLAGCRTIMRPGAMWFIKDPSDQNFHPIRDILDRPHCAIMYGLVVACGVGSIGGLMRLGRGLVLPLRWKPREPLSDIPIDLLFLHILLPYTLRFFRPRKVLRKTSIKIWKYLCAWLRLTSYMFGGRHPEEEREPSHPSWFPFQDSGSKAAESEPRSHGSYRRVPNSDNVAVPRDMRATARVDADGLPVDDEARMLIEIQDAEAEKAKRNPKDDYTVVHIPPHFQHRIGLLIFALWVIGCLFVTASVTVPVLLGRGVFNLFTKRQMHDGYSFLVGFYALWGCWVVGHAIERMEKRRQRRSADEAHIVHHFFVGIVIPTLIGLVVELYLIMPIRLLLNPDLVPNVRAVDMWALGIIYAKIVLHAHRLRPLNRITTGFNHIKAHGWTNPEPLSATVEVIAPLLAGLVGMLGLPPTAVAIVRYVSSLQVDQRFIFMHVYPGIFALVGIIRLGLTGSGALARWSQTIRDTEFLVEMRLRNYEQEKDGEEKKEKEKEKEKENGHNKEDDGDVVAGTEGKAVEGLAVN
ncbi:hypothetical protein B0F90DRAFT_1757507 [Multifurca ochricompacta]|uniref:RING-type E3 ubiquitin transferase n=1 Tax=Multifurca ochricompacta TaxID=376703 RepID=A0AAD4LXK2_9AGAM|nr:hypothetical protein B0F90DRAFT_1757507 [Multifurca ochricompacta]